MGSEQLWCADTECLIAGVAHYPDDPQCIHARPATKAVDMVNHPPHYTAHPSGVECIQITEHMGFNVGNAVKYLWRADEKGNAIEDLEKARWYVEREIAKRKAESVPKKKSGYNPATGYTYDEKGRAVTHDLVHREGPA